MNKLELVNLLQDYPDDVEILIFPQFDGIAEDGEEIKTGAGIGVAYKDELFFLGEVQEVAEVEIGLEEDDLSEWKEDDEYDFLEELDDEEDDI